MPRDLILGTAGHIDHGKTSLVKALTGIDCDRLPEEKERGITIDIGFASLDLGDFHLGIVDVQHALRASHAWARLNPAVREIAVENGNRPDFLALVGVFLALGEPLAGAASSGFASSSVCFTTRLEAGRAARRGLAAIADEDAALLEPLRSRLLAALPEDPENAEYAAS